MAVAEVLSAVGAGGALIGTAYVEGDADLADASTIALGRVMAHKVPRQYLARNAWDLLRHDLDPLFRFAESLPVGAFLLAMAGTCPFSPLGPRSCRKDLGLRGNDPSEFYATPAILWALARWRPDVTIHAVVKIPSEASPCMRGSMAESLGITNAQGAVLATDAAGWSPTTGKSSS